MKTKQWRGRSSAIVLAAGSVFNCALSAWGQTVVTWSASMSGNWTDPVRWSSNPNYPNNGTPAGATYDVTIAQPGSYIIDLGTDIAVDHLTLNTAAGSTLAHYAGTFAPTLFDLKGGTYQLSGGTLTNTRVTGSGGQFFNPGLGGTLNNVTFAGSLTLGTRTLAVQNGLTLANATLGFNGFGGASSYVVSLANGTGIAGTGDVYVDRGATVSFSPGAAISSGVTVRPGRVGAFTSLSGGVTMKLDGVTNYGRIITDENVAPNIALTLDGSGATGTGTFTNSGTLNSETAALTMIRVYNTGTINANPWGRMTITNMVGNTGTITGGPLGVTVSGSHTLAQLGNYTSPMTTVSGTLDLTGSTLNLDTFGTLLSTGATYIGGTIAAPLTNRVAGVSGAVLRNMILATDASTQGTLTVQGSLALSGKTLTQQGASLHFGDTTDQALTGTGEVVLGTGTGSSGVTVSQDVKTLTLGPGIVVRTPSSTSTATSSISGVFSGATIVNNGIIRSNTAGRTMRVSGKIANNGTIEAKDGGILTLAGTWTNTGTISVNNGTLNWGINPLTNTGTISVTNSNLYIARTMTEAEYRALPAATNKLGVAPAGTLDLGTGTLNLDSGIGSLYLAGGSVKAGRVTAEPGYQIFSVTGTTSTLSSSMSLATNLNVAPGSVVLTPAVLTLENTNIVLNGSSSAPTSSTLLAVQNLNNQNTLTGTGTISFSGSSGNSVQAAGSSNALVLGPGITVQTGPEGGKLVGPIINKGLVSAETAGKTLTIASSSSFGGFDNTNGTLQAKNGGTVVVNYGVFNTTTSLPSSAGKIVVGANSKMLIGVDRTYDINAADVTMDGPGSQFPALDDGFRFSSNTGKFTIKNGRNWVVENNFSNSGTLTVGKNSTFTVWNDPGETYTLTNTSTAKLKGKGTIQATVISDGTISPGESPGVLTILGNLTQSSTSVLEIELGGVTPGTEFDVLDVSGTATLNGTLRILLVDGFVPADGQTFDFINAGTMSGSFSSFDLPPLPGGQQWDTTALMSGGTLRTTPEPGGLAVMAVGLGLLGRRGSRRRG
ncbi:MAG TPA: hypothetical protein VF669_14440 [Tepidisphaeraceae bacterium]|jgi:hypothetical protein